jgi:hypothetical protein
VDPAGPHRPRASVKVYGDGVGLCVLRIDYDDRADLWCEVVMAGAAPLEALLALAQGD